MDITLLTRESKLALWQANAVKQSLEAQHPDIRVTLCGHTTLGDRDKSTPLSELGNKNCFASELQAKLRHTPNAIAVHSLKDLSVHTPEDLALGACLPRADARDVLISPHDNACLLTLPKGARIGTGSPRRRAQLAKLRPDFELCDIRGNVPTRVDACLSGEFDAIVLAAAGLERLSMTHVINHTLPFDDMLPAIGQGIVAVEYRQEDVMVGELLKTINHPDTWGCAQAERAVNEVLDGDCHTPIAAFAQCDNNDISITATVLSHDGQNHLKERARGPITEAYQLGKDLGQLLLDNGALEVLGQN